ncbi:MAG: hypothetical protein H6622_17035 [Halobacteriovoraceae bacterium]|nr:hypothetical protein [Halobacteriovoraceae bacterium]
MSSKLILLLSFLLIASSYAQAPDPNTEGAESDRPTQQTEETSSNDEKSINQVQMNPSQTSREDIVLIYSEEKKHFIDSNNKKANLLELISEKKKSVTVLFRV